MQVEDGGADLADDLLQIVDRSAQPLLHRRRPGSGNGALQRQPDGEQPLDHMVVQVPGDPVPVGDDVEFVHPPLCGGQLPGQRGLIGECGHHVELFGAERDRFAVPYDDDDTGHRVRGAQRQHQRRPDIIDAGQRQPADALRKALGEGRADRGAGYRDRLPGEARDCGTGCFNHQQFDGLAFRSVLVERYGDQGRFGAGEFAGFFGDQPEHRGGIGSRQQFGGDVAGGLDPGLPCLGLRVQPGVGDGDPGGGGQRLNQYLIVLAERPARWPSRRGRGCRTPRRVPRPARRGTCASSDVRAENPRTPGGRRYSPGAAAWGLRSATRPRRVLRGAGRSVGRFRHRCLHGRTPACAGPGRAPPGRRIWRRPGWWRSARSSAAWRRVPVPR